MVSGRTAFISISLTAHVAVAIAIDRIPIEQAHAATPIEITESKRPTKKTPPPPAKLTPPAKPPRSSERRVAAPKLPAAPPLAAPPPAGPLADLPDFGLSLSGGIDGAGMALPNGGGVRRAPAAESSAKGGPRRLASAVPALDPCEERALRPKPRNVPQPLGTEAARAAGVEGKVRVQLSVDETGHVTDVRLLAGLGYGLDEAALAAARRAEFEPATRCGKPVRATFNISMRFTL